MTAKHQAEDYPIGGVPLAVVWDMQDRAQVFAQALKEVQSAEAEQLAALEHARGRTNYHLHRLVQVCAFLQRYGATDTDYFGLYGIGEHIDDEIEVVVASESDQPKKEGE